MKEVSGNYFYNPNIKTSADDGDGFYSAGTSTKDVAKDLDFYGKYYLGPKEKLKKYNIDIEDNEDIEDYEDAEEYSPMYDNYEERQVDLLSLPVYYHIAFAIPADLSFDA